MRHGKKDNHLGRTASHRQAMLQNMAASLILHKRIETTVAKAKELRKFVEPLLTRAKEDNTHNRRVVFSYLHNKEIIKELFGNVSDKISDRPGGYTRIIKLGQRLGDAAEICMIELVDFNETTVAQAADKPAKTRRSRRGGGGKKEGAAETVKAVAIAEEPTVIEQEAEVIEEEIVENATPKVEQEQAIAVNTELDDLKIVEGIGPKIAEALNNAGVSTFAQLADMTPEAINEIISGAGISSRDASTWPKQAEMARDGKIDELKAWQDELNGGKE